VRWNTDQKKISIPKVICLAETFTHTLVALELGVLMCQCAPDAWCVCVCVCVCVYLVDVSLELLLVLRSYSTRSQIRFFFW
jgi:hypothetical protein